MNKSDFSVFKRMPTLVTERLILRKMLPTDAEDMYEYAKIPDVSRYLLWEPHKSLKVSHNYLKFLQTQYAAGNFYDWALTLASSGKMVGTCGFSSFDTENRTAEIGYVLSPQFRGRGIAPEAVRRVMSFGFEKLKLHRIFARIIEGNTASERVALKCGMRHEATLRSSLLVKGEFKTIKIYAILREEYLNLR